MMVICGQFKISLNYFIIKQCFLLLFFVLILYGFFVLDMIIRCSGC